MGDVCVRVAGAAVGDALVEAWAALLKKEAAVATATVVRLSLEMDDEPAPIARCRDIALQRARRA